MKTDPQAKIIKADFLEPVLVPAGAKGVGEFVEKYRASSGGGPLSMRAQGPGLLLEVEGGRQFTIIPWTNVRSVVVEQAPAAEEKAK